jgi:alkylation response protein AidB-like acyl-CoA dehydrogenase
MAPGAYPQIPLDFGFTEEHELLRTEARRFLEERCPFSEVRRIAESAEGFDAGLWKDLASLGWVGLTLPEAHGGAGLGALHLALVLEEMGRRLLPSPYLAAILAGFALVESRDASAIARLAPAIASGSTLATLALHEPGGAWLPEELSATAEAAEGGYVLRGSKPFVLAGASARLLIAPFREGDGRLGLYAVELPAKGVRVEPETGVDPTRRTARIELEGARVPREARLAGDGAATLRAAHVRGFAALAAEMVGGAEAVLGVTREYAIARKQFDRQIGSFQGVKYPIVDMMIGTELARTHALAAAAALDHAGGAGDSAVEVAARMAKAIASDVYPQAVRKGVQLHGGFGFTWDCDVHFYFKRALWSRAVLGDAGHHRRRLAEALLGPAGAR